MLRRVKAGEPLRFDADGENAKVDAAEHFQRRQRLGEGGAPFNAVRGRLVKVKNGSSGTVPVGGVLGISGLAISPTANFDHFARRPIFTGVAPQIETHGGKFVIAQEPIKQNEVGRCVISGETFAQVNLVDVDDVMCGITDDSTEKLTSGMGLCRILAIPSGASTGDNWCWVRIGDTNSSFVAKTTSTISALSGSTPGSGTVDLYAINSSGNLAAFRTSLTVYSWATSTTTSGVWGWVDVDGFGRPFFNNEDCP